MITFGVSYDPSTESELDPADHLMRLRLVYTILDTCGVFFSSGLSKKRLDFYLVYLQYYYWFKRSLPVWTDDNPFPIEIDFGIKDTLTSLRPKLKPHKSLQEASDAVEKLEKDIVAKLSQTVHAFFVVFFSITKISKGVFFAVGSQMPELKLDGDLSDEALACIDEEEADDVEEVPAALEMDDDLDEDRSLSQSTSQRTRGDATASQPEDAVGAAGVDVLDDDDAGGGGGGDGGDDDDDSIVVTQRRPKTTCPEDEDFMAALDRMVAENIHERSKEAVKVISRN